MSTELYTPRSYPVSTSPRDFGSTYSCSSSEASSRLAARLERSEYKRSRGKQRLKDNYNSSRNHSRRRENRGSKRKNSPKNILATRETRTKSEEDGVTSVWEVYRQNPHQFSEERTYTLDKPRSWYGVPNEMQDPQKRPRSMHDKPMADRDFTPPHSPRLSRRQEPRNSNSYEYSKSPLHSEDFQPKRTDATHKINGDNSYQGHKTMNNYDANQYQTTQNRNLDKKGVYLSRSLSSSYSSNVGSSDEREDSQGIYSAYDMAGRSPYDSMLNRRYSQSSLSSSNASWHHSGSSFNYNVRDIPPLLDPIDKSQESSLLERPSEQSEYDRHLREEFRLVKETPAKVPPPVAPKPSKYSSSYTIQLHSSSPATWKESHFPDLMTDNKESSFLQNQPLKTQQCLTSPVTPKTMEGSNEVDGKIVSVREMARKFTPTSVRHISSEIHTKTISGEDTRKVKAEHWPKVVSIMHQESSPAGNIEDIPPTRPPYPNDKVHSSKGVVMRNKEETQKNNEELASHRLSLHELIKLHEEQIAKQAKSAKTVLTASVYVKHSPSDSSQGQSRTPEYNYFELKDLKTELSQEFSPVNNIHESNQNLLKDENVMSMAKQQIRHSGYEVREVKTEQNSPFKVIELTGKSFENLSNGGTRDRSPRVKRHRTIGIVGYRQQIDRTAEEKAPTKQKRHTTVGIVHDFKEINDTKADLSESLVINDDKIKPSPSNDYESQKKTNDRHQEGRKKQEDQTTSMPVKVFDIEKGQDPQNLAHMEKTVESYEEPSQGDQSDGKPKEPLITTSPTNYWYSSYAQKDLSEVDKYIPAISVSPDNYKEDTLPRSIEKEPQKSLLPTSEAYARTPQGAESRNLHSPVIELLQNRKGNPTAYYKAAVQVVSHSVPSNHKERVSSTSHSEQKLGTSFDDVFHQSKPYSVPVAQVSPVNQNEIIQAKAIQLASPPPDPPSAHEMYETRLAMWNLLPHQNRLTGDLTEHQSNELSFGDKSKQSLSSKEIPRSPLYRKTPTKDYQGFAEKQNRFSEYPSQNQKDEYYSRIIEKLKEENQRLKEKNEAEKQEFRRMYEEQKKVANAYQKLEDRYRRRVHELQDALANCTCQGSIMVKDGKNPRANKSDKESQSSKTQSINSGMHIFEELEEWLTEQSKNTKASKVNATSRDSLISSSSDLTGWDDHVDGAIDQVNGTHV
ncbi:uncharacterized protein LOC116295305 [Actinia tenebrosa]|uniref:Uncharacterized protein LOC116295305 n=1 Tax=Actinia tenebrosa TaxID=6105 RepID=A0A6P8HU59_ACTTE|nr:uncharacterized protein LOC116295305 [Actinia tenebrosa]